MCALPKLNIGVNIFVNESTNDRKDIMARLIFHDQYDLDSFYYYDIKTEIET